MQSSLVSVDNRSLFHHDLRAVNSYLGRWLRCVAANEVGAFFGDQRIEKQTRS